MKIIYSTLILILLFHVSTGQKTDVYHRPVQQERSRDFDAIHYRITLNVDMEKKVLSGENMITLCPLNDNFDKFSLDAEYLVVNKISTKEGENLNFGQNDKEVLIKLPKSYSHSDTLTIVVKYSLSTQVKGLLFIDESPSNPKMVSSDCWPDKARQWIPCYDYPNDKATNEMIVTVDKKYKVLSNGRLISLKENELQGTMTYHWSQDLPQSTYLINLSIADYAVVKDSLGSLPVNYWVYPWLEDDARSTFHNTPNIIKYFSKLFNYNYPWAKYDQVITSYMGGGAEATSATLLGEGIVMDTMAEKDFSKEGVIAHEISHQWWGDLVTLRSWDQAWLNESFATYSEYLYTRSVDGEDAGAYNLLQKKNSYLKEVHTKYMRPIVFSRYNEPGDNFDNHIYPKGACMLHFLRHILGDETFFRVLSTFLHQNEFRAVDTHDLMKTIKEVSGKNMDWFFEQFIFNPGHPVFEVTKLWDASAKKLKMTIVQKQDSIQGIPIYTIPVNLGFTFPDKKIVKEIWLKNKVENFEFNFPSEPLLVRFDEGNYILKEVIFKKSPEELICQAENDDMTGRLTSVDELVPFGNNRLVQNLWSRLAINDPFWAIRQAALEHFLKYSDEIAMVGKSQTEDEYHHGSSMRPLKNKLYTYEKTIQLSRLCLKDKSSKVRQSAIHYIGNLKDPKMISLLESSFNTENSYAVQAECLKAIGIAGSKRQLNFLKEVQKRRSYMNIVGKAASDAIAMIRKK